MGEISQYTVMLKAIEQRIGAYLRGVRRSSLKSHDGFVRERQPVLDLLP